MTRTSGRMIFRIARLMDLCGPADISWIYTICVSMCGINIPIIKVSAWRPELLGYIWEYSPNIWIGEWFLNGMCSCKPRFGVAHSITDSKLPTEVITVKSEITMRNSGQCGPRLHRTSSGRLLAGAAVAALLAGCNGGSTVNGSIVDSNGNIDGTDIGEVPVLKAEHDWILFGQRQ